MGVAVGGEVAAAVAGETGGETEVRLLFEQDAADGVVPPAPP